MPIDTEIFGDLSGAIIPSDDIFKDVPAKTAAPVKPVRLGLEGFRDTLRDEYKNLNWADRQIIAAGTGMANLWERAKQVAGKGDPNAIAANRVIAKENPGAAIVGNLAMLAPTAMIPGVNTYAGAAALGGILGAAQPTLEGESTALNTATGAAFGLGGQYLGNKIGDYASRKIAETLAARSRNTLKDAILQESKNAGYIIPKSEVAPTFINNALESVAGKAALKQDATLRNQEVSNSLGRSLIGLADDQPLTREAIRIFRDNAAQPYKEVAALNPRAAYALEKLKETRNEAQAQWAFYNRSMHPQALKDAKALDAKAAHLEQLIDGIAQKANDPSLLSRLVDARKAIAQAYTLERATNPVTGDVSARVLGALAAKGKPLSDELATVAKFQQTFPKFAGNAVETPAPGVSALQPMAAGLLASGNLGYLGAGLPFLRTPVRDLLLSKAYQNLAAPSYGTGGMQMLNTLGQQLPAASAYFGAQAQPLSSLYAGAQ